MIPLLWEVFEVPLPVRHDRQATTLAGVSHGSTSQPRRERPHGHTLFHRGKSRRSEAPWQVEAAGREQSHQGPPSLWGCHAQGTAAGHKVTSLEALHRPAPFITAWVCKGYSTLSKLQRTQQPAPPASQPSIARGPAASIMGYAGSPHGDHASHGVWPHCPMCVGVSHACLPSSLFCLWSCQGEDKQS